MTAVTANYNAWYFKSDGSNDFVLISEPNIEMKLLDINYATFISPVPVVTDSFLSIYYIQKQVVFYGYVSQCKQLNRNVDGKTRYEIEVQEPAAKLKNKYMSSTAISGVYILNDIGNRTLGQYVATIISGMSDWRDITNSASSKLPDGLTAIPSMGFSSCTVWSALQRLIISQFGYGLWFQYQNPGANAINQLKYGEYNNSFSNWPVPLSIKVVESSINYKIDGIVVYGDDKTLKATAGTITPDNRTLCYRYSGCQNKDELQAVANKIYNDRSQIKSRYEIEFPIDLNMLKIQEGDRIFISDTASGMTPQANGYGVKDVRITTEKVTVGIGAADVTIFDILADRLSVIDGDVVAYNNKEISIGSVTCASADLLSGGSSAWGASHDVDFNIEGVTFFGDLTITPSLTAPGKDGGGYFTCFMLASSPTSDLTVTNTAIVYDLIVDASGDPIPEYFPWSIKWAELEATYIFKSGVAYNVLGTQVTWDASWGDLEMFDDGTLQPSSSIRRTITHKWFIGEHANIAMSNPQMTVVHSGNGTFATLQDLFIKVAVYFDGEVIDELFAFTGQVKMQLLSPQSVGSSTFVTVGNEITIYDSDDEATYYDREKNIWKTYTMTDLGITLDNMLVGPHRIRYTCKGNSNVGVSTYGKYLSFDENVSIVKGQGIVYDY
jgi:hypothetical protein